MPRLTPSLKNSAMFIVSPPCRYSYACPLLGRVMATAKAFFRLTVAAMNYLSQLVITALLVPGTRTGSL